MSSVLRMEALENLRCLIEREIPELAGAICVGVGAPGHTQGRTSLAIKVTRWQRTLFQAAKVQTIDPTTILMDVGYHKCTVQLRVTAPTPEERYRLSQALVDLFMATPLHPGTIMVPATGKCGERYIATFDYSGDDWNDEFAFDRKYAVINTCEAQVPIVATREGYTISEIAQSFAMGAGELPPDGSATEDYITTATELTIA